MGMRFLGIVFSALFLAGPICAQTPPAPAATTPEKPKEKLPLEKILARLPRRVTTKDGKPGDMVNFLLVGRRETIEQSLEAAGWIKVDRTPEDAVVHALSEVLEHRAYAEMPMSQLYLFGRPQDYGYAQGIPIQVVTERHHFRLWEAPWLTEDGQPVWVGAGTHDIGIERDANQQLTHAIDPDVDKERDFVAQSLRDEDKVTQTRYLVPAKPVRRAFTATGDPFHSDGRILVLFLK